MAPSPKQCLTIAVMGAKGGSGKTTATVILAAAFAHLGRNTLAIDLDPQADASMRLLASDTEGDPFANGAADVIEGKTTLVDAIQGTRFPKLDVLPSGTSLDETAVSMVGKRASELIVRKTLISPLKQSNVYEVILIDCPPGLSPLSLGAIVAADYIISPVRASDPDSIGGYTTTVEVIEDLQDLQPGKHIGVIVTDIEPANRRKMIQRGILETVQGLGAKVLGEWNSRASYSTSQGARLLPWEWEPKGPVLDTATATARNILKATKTTKARKGAKK